MNNFEAIKTNYLNPQLLQDLLAVYERRGQNQFLINQLEQDKPYLKEKILDIDSIKLAKFIGLNISENRIRLLIKGSSPLNKHEQSFLALRSVIQTIQQEALNIPFNGSEILQYLNMIFGKNSHKFTNRIYNDILVQDFDPKKTSIRAMTEKIIDEYYKSLQTKAYEPLFLSLITFLQIDLMHPYDKNNEFAAILMLYYMLFASGFSIFNYVSFFEPFINNLSKFNETKKLCYVNYPQTPLNINILIPQILSIIKDAYLEIEKYLRSRALTKHQFKTDGIEQTIFHLTNTFTKDDIRMLHPNVSDSTLNRVLIKLRDEKIIMPLGKGRSARWIKLISEDDPRNIFGGNYNGNQD